MIVATPLCDVFDITLSPRSLRDHIRDRLAAPLRRLKVTIFKFVLQKNNLKNSKNPFEICASQQRCIQYHVSGEWGEMIQTNWSRDGLRLKIDNLRRCCRLQDRGAVQGRSESRWRDIAHRRGGREARLARGGIREHDAFLGHEMRGPAGTGLVGASIELKNRLRSSLSNILVLDILPIPYCVVDMRVPTKTHRRFQLSVYPLTRFHPRPLCRHACAHVHDQYSSYFVNSMNPMCSLYLAFVKVYSKYMLLYSWVLTKR